MIETVRVGVDFSAQSAVAVDQALAIARRAGAALELIHANEAFHEISLLGEQHPESLVSFLEASEQSARDQLGSLRALCESAGVHARATVVRAPALQALNAEPGCLLVIGATGVKGLDRLLVGSTTARVVRAASGPVLVARRGRLEYGRVLVATDFGVPARHALDTATELAAGRAAVTLLHAWRMPALFTEYTPPQQYADLAQRLSESAEEAAAEQAAPLVELLERRGFAVAFHAVCGDPAATIVERSAGYDLIAVGTMGRRGARRLVSGSVAARVVANAPCSVLVAH